jgi:hypothetical protein
MLVSVAMVLGAFAWPAKAADELSRPPAGFTSLFNGHDLTGWKGLVGNPKKRADMSDEELAAAQARANQDMREHWKVVDGVLVFDGKGHSLCTAKDYGDFEMLVDWKIEAGGDSGIYLRGSPQVQIWDTSRKTVGAQVGSGGLYNNKKHPSKPLKAADKPIGEWNTFRIIMIDDKVTVYLNDVLVVDHVTMENYWERDKPIYPRGQIELQAHNSTLWFRNIFIKPINELTEREKADGFELLFNGQNLEGWTNAEGREHKGYVVKDGMIVVEPELAGGNLYTARQYGDFVMRFEFKLTPGANNGLGIRTPRGVNAAYNGMELQILDNTADKYKNLKDYQFHGSIYGVVPAKRGYLKPVGEWDYQQVTAEEKQIKVELNGTTIVDANIAEASEGGTIDHRDHPGLKRTEGYIAFCGHGDRLAFRNLRIKTLD